MNNLKKRALLTLVSEQPMPAVIQMIQSDFIYDKYAFVISADSKSDALYNKEFEAVCQRESEFLQEIKGPGVIIEKLDPVNPYNINHVEKVINSYIQENSEYSWEFNITGGTKTMSIAAYNVALKSDSEVLYVDSWKRRIFHYSGKSNEPKIQHFDETLFKPIITVENYLKLNGNEKWSKIKTGEISQANMEKAEFMAEKNKGYYTPFFKDLKKKATEFYQKHNITRKYSVSLADLSSCTNPDVSKLHSLHRKGILSFDKDVVSFKDGEDFKFFQGTWLEVYTKKLLDESGYFDDVRVNIEFPGIDSEWDLMVTAQGKFALLECKSTPPELKSYGQLKGMVENIRGLYSKSFLICAKSFDMKNEYDSKSHDIMNDRVNFLGITAVIYGENLKKMALTIANKMELDLKNKPDT